MANKKIIDDTDNDFNLMDCLAFIMNCVDFIKDHAKYIIYSVVFCGCLGVIYALLAPEKYAAISYIQMAQVADKEVEPRSLVAEKLKIAYYLSSETIDQCEPSKENLMPDPPFLAFSVYAKKDTPFLALAYTKGTSPDHAKACLQLIFNDIQAHQALLASPHIENKKTWLAALEQKLIDKQHSQAELTKNVAPATNSDFILHSLLNINDQHTLSNQINELKNALSPPATQETKLIAPIYASKYRVEPKRTAIVIRAMCAGFFLSLLYFVGRKASQTIRQRLLLKRKG